MVLSYSRLRLLVFSLRAAMPSFLAGHVKAFRFFKAAPRTILYDYVPRHEIVVLWPSRLRGRAVRTCAPVIVAFVLADT
jgi:transposase